jgi:hypothetical protein
MIYDENILRIIFRSARGHYPDIMMKKLMMKYINMLREAISVASTEYYLNEEDININSFNDVQKIIDKVKNDINDPNNVKLGKYIDDEIQRVNDEFLQFYVKTTNPGNLMYLIVYIKSKLEELKSELNNESDKVQSLNLLKDRKKEIRKLQNSMNILKKISQF